MSDLFCPKKREEFINDLMDIEARVRMAALAARKRGMTLEEFIQYVQSEWTHLEEHRQDYERLYAHTTVPTS